MQTAILSLYIQVSFQFSLRRVSIFLKIALSLKNSSFVHHVVKDLVAAKQSGITRKRIRVVINQMFAVDPGKILLPVVSCLRK